MYKFDYKTKSNPEIMEMKSDSIVVKNRQYLIAHSGEIYYVEDGVLKKKKSIQEYQDMLEEEKRLAELYFEITINKCYYKIQLANKKKIFAVLDTIEDFEIRCQEQLRYFKEREKNNL
ncbi:MAG: hypothetical protein PF513_03105 [Tenericutes bacterium]|jgi:hypothetical protein|nr:hypothetical protein [Mycoplasmatota bacterium]